MKNSTATPLCLLLFCSSAGVRADDLMENDDLGPGGDLGELPSPPVGQHVLIDQNSNNNDASIDQAGTELSSAVPQSGNGMSVSVKQYR